MIATRCARWAFAWFDRPQHYPEPIVGSIAWSAATKAPDYAAPVALVAGFLAALVLLSAVSARIHRALGAPAAARIDGFLLVASAPAGAWVAGLMTTPSTSFALLDLSVKTVVLVIGAAALLSMRGEAFWQRDGTQFPRLLGTSLLLLPGIWLGVYAASIALSRLRGLRHGSPLGMATVESAASAALLVAGVALAAVLLLSRTAARAERTIRGWLLALQILFPAFFLVLVPRPWLVHGRAALGYPLTTWAWLLIAVLMAAALVDLARTARRARGSASDDPFTLVTVMSTAGAVIALRATPLGLPVVSSDDYHFGEMLVPWWSLTHEHMLPFADYSPARGLLNYMPGAAASLFFDGTAASVDATWAWVYLPIVLLAVPVLRWTLGPGWAALALVMALPANGISEIDIVVTVFLAVTCRGAAEWRPHRWMVAWIATGTALVLFAPGQGGLAVLATLPVGAWMALRGLSGDRIALLRSLAATTAVAVAAVLLTPLGRMIFGAVRYGAEQSAVNSVAHGIPWAMSFGTSGTNPLLFEVARASWLFAALWAGILVVEGVRARRAGGAPPFMPYAVSILILATMFVFRAAGRIDVGPSRLGLASMWGICLLLPLLLHASLPPHKRGGAVLAWVAIAGLILPYFGGFPTSYAHAFETIRGVPDAVAEHRPTAPPELKLGAAITDAAHVARLTSARTLLDRVLDPGETYLDLSGRHAQYFYFDRRPPIETGSVYNLVAEAQQRRAVEALRRAPPPAVLLSAENLLIDGGPLGLRSHLLYRHVLTYPEYEVVVVGSQVWLLRRDRVPRLAAGAPAIEHRVHAVDDATDNPLHGVLQAQELAAIPAAWGASAATLEREMRTVHALPPGAPDSSVEALEDGRYRVVHPHPRVLFDLSSLALDGADAGVLSFDFRCERAKGPPPRVELRWSSASVPEMGDGHTRVRFEGRDGRLIVPLDASPAWFLARRIGSLRLEVLDETSCAAFQVTHVRLLQRHGAEAAPARRH